MRFEDAFKYFREGDCLRRKNWPKEYFIKLTSCHECRPEEHLENLDIIDLLSDDWVIMDDI
jgi:hypothetical protein